MCKFSELGVTVAPGELKQLGRLSLLPGLWHIGWSACAPHAGLSFYGSGACAAPCDAHACLPEYITFMHVVRSVE